MKTKGTRGTMEIQGTGETMGTQGTGEPEELGEHEVPEKQWGTEGTLEQGEP